MMQLFRITGKIKNTILYSLKWTNDPIAKLIVIKVADNNGPYPKRPGSGAVKNHPAIIIKKKK